MITLNLKNKHIFFAVEAIWNELDYRFKYQINEKVSKTDENGLIDYGADDYVQTIDVDRATLNKILVSVNNKPQGVAREINPEMFMAILPQVQALATGGNEEAAEILSDIQAATAANDALKQAKIINGKTQILS